MGQIVLAIRSADGQRTALEALARRVIPGDWWTIAGRHLVDARLEFPASVVPDLAQGFHGDVNCQDPESPIGWTAEPYTLFAASGDWDEDGGRAALDALTAWVAGVLPGVEWLHAGLTAPDAELTLRFSDGGWETVDRY
ncbi:MAG: hypothetical protein U0556_14255 [Dehalococcoidia bacterium]